MSSIELKVDNMNLSVWCFTFLLNSSVLADFQNKLKEHQDKPITTMFMISLAQNKPKTQNDSGHLSKRKKQDNSGVAPLRERPLNLKGGSSHHYLLGTDLLT
jgi:hypothetical protein